MLSLKKLLAVPAALFTVALVSIGASRMSNEQLPAHGTKWVTEKNSTLRVQGKSNVNSFSCNINEYTKKDTILLGDDPAKPIRLFGTLQMDVFSFNCHSSLITKDLRKTLKAQEYPKMIIRFISLQASPVLENKTELIKGVLEVELAGVVKRFELCYSFSSVMPGYIQLSGGRKFCFSDFKLSPPRKMAGLIKINDEFDVNFQLVLRAIR